MDGEKGRVDGGDGGSPGRGFGSTIGKWGCFDSKSRLETCKKIKVGKNQSQGERTGYGNAPQLNPWKKNSHSLLTPTRHSMSHRVLICLGEPDIAV